MILICLCMCTNHPHDLVTAKKNHKTPNRGNMNFTLPVNAVDPLNIPKQPSPLKSAQQGLHDPHVLKTNITLRYQSCYLESSLFLLDSCWKVTEVRGGHVSCCAVANSWRGCERGRATDGSTHTLIHCSIQHTHKSGLSWFNAEGKLYFIVG